MKCYRIEHIESGLGPFTHGGQIEAVINKALKIRHNKMLDLDDVDSVKKCLKTNPDNVRYAYDSIDGCLSIVRDIDLLTSYGFIIKEYDVSDENVIYFSELDRQVVFVMV